MRYNVPMKPKFLILLLPLLMSGCFNDRGVSLRYYSDCEEYYDNQGYLHKKCDKNLIDYKEAYEAVMPRENPKKGSVE